MAVVSITRDYFHVGDRAASSGIYRAMHNGHRKNHTLVVVRGDQFPRCRFCKDAAVFLLLESAPYIAHDIDFAGPSLEQANG